MFNRKLAVTTVKKNDDDSINNAIGINLLLDKGQEVIINSAIVIGSVIIVVSFAKASIRVAEHILKS